MFTTKARKVLLISTIAIGLAVAAVAYIPLATEESKWAELDSFKTELPALLGGSDNDPRVFNIKTLAEKLGAVRVDGMAVCAPEEISAEQYIELAEVVQRIEAHNSVMAQLNDLLDSDKGISDCQFRVLVAATRMDRGQG